MKGINYKVFLGPSLGFVRFFLIIYVLSFSNKRKYSRSVDTELLDPLLVNENTGSRKALATPGLLKREGVGSRRGCSDMLIRN